MSLIKVSIRSPNNHFNGLDIDANNEWKIKDLKKSIQENCPDGQNIESQRIVYSGRLLRDEEEIRKIFPSTNPSHIIHVLFCMKATEVKERLSKNDVDEMKKEYLEYLKEFYSKNINPYQSYANLMNNQIQNQQQYHQQDNNTFSNSEIPPENQPPQPGFLRRFLRNFLLRNNDEEAGEGPNELDLFAGLFRLSIIFIICFSYFGIVKIIAILLVILFIYLFRIYHSVRQLNRVINRLHERNVVQVYRNEPQELQVNEENDSQSQTNNTNARQNLTLIQMINYYSVIIIHTIWSFFSTIIPERVQ